MTEAARLLLQLASVCTARIPPEMHKRVGIGELNACRKELSVAVTRG
jgi:hypothetical protein